MTFKRKTFTFQKRGKKIENFTFCSVCFTSCFNYLTFKSLKFINNLLSLRMLQKLFYVIKNSLPAPSRITPTNCLGNGFKQVRAYFFTKSSAKIDIKINY